MRKSLIGTLAVLAALALVSGAAAQLPPPGQNLLGIYSNDFDGPTWANVPGTGMITIYLICSGITSPSGGVSGWEAEVFTEGTGAMLLSAVVQGQNPLNIMTPPAFMVGLQAPMRDSNIGIPFAFSLAEMTYFVSSTAETFLRVDRPTQFSSFNDHPDGPGPGYADADDPGILIRFQPSSGDLSQPVFGFNTGGLGIRVEDETWGGIKGLFR